MTLAAKRLIKEIKDINNNTIEGISINFTDNINEIDAIIYGPPDTPYENGEFKLRIHPTDQYPLKPPSVKFISNIFHPNVYKDGKICVDILQSEWTPTLKISTVLLSIRSLLMDPNPRSPANPEAAKLFTKDINQFNEYVRKTINIA
jgi:ubiquitin-conjugating enzyme E2 A